MNAHDEMHQAVIDVMHNDFEPAGLERLASIDPETARELVESFEISADDFEAEGKSFRLLKSFGVYEAFSMDYRKKAHLLLSVIARNAARQAVFDIENAG